METAWMVLVIILMICILFQAVSTVHLVLRLRRMDRVLHVHLKHHAENFGDYVKKRIE